MFSGDFGAKLKGSFLSGGGNKKKTAQVNKTKSDGVKKGDTKVSLPTSSASGSHRTVPLRDLPTEVVIPIFEKADLSSLCKMRRASRSIDSIVEENKKEIFKHRKDKITLAIPIEEKRFMMFVNKTLLVNPGKQLYGITVEKVEIYFGAQNVNASTMKNLVTAVKNFTLNAEPIQFDWERYPLCGVLYFLRNAEVLFRGIIRENIDRLMEELVSFPQPRLLPHFSLQQHYISSLPIYLRHVWTTENIRRKKLPIDAHVMILPSDDLLIGINSSVDLEPKANPSPFDDNKGMLLKVWIVKNEQSEILTAVKKAFPNDEKYDGEIAEIVKNMNIYFSDPDNFFY